MVKINVLNLSASFLSNYRSYLSREVFGKSLKSKVDEQLTATVGAAVEATNVEASTSLEVQFDRSNPKRQRCSLGSTAVLEKNDKNIQDTFTDRKSSPMISNFEKTRMEVLLFTISVYSLRFDAPVTCHLVYCYLVISEILITCFKSCY